MKRTAGASLEHYVADRVWIDVGSYMGEYTLEAARSDPKLTVFAFEPNLKVAVETYNLLENYIVVPVAVAETDGFAPLYLNSFDAASSLLPFNLEGLEQWVGGEFLQIESEVIVPTVRLDTFMDRMGIATVEYLKIDAQGADAEVVGSTGERLKDIEKVTLEVAITAVQLYSGAREKSAIVEFMEGNGFALTDIQPQTHGQEENLTFIRKTDPK